MLRFQTETVSRHVIRIFAFETELMYLVEVEGSTCRASEASQCPLGMTDARHSETPLQ